MVRRVSQFLLLLCCCLLGAVVIPATRPSVSVRSRPELIKLKPADPVRISRSYGRLPLSFEANRGQVDSEVKYLSRGNGYVLFLTATEMVLSLPGKSLVSGLRNRGGVELEKEFADPMTRLRDLWLRASQPRLEASRSNVIRLKLEGANPSPKAAGSEELPGKVNYFIGNDPAKWRRDVTTYARVKYSGVYPGIDLVHYGNQGQLEHDFIVAPGSDPGDISFSIGNSDGISIDAQGNLLLDEKGRLMLRKPRIYQQSRGIHTEIEGGYALKDSHHVGFRVQEYDVSLPLVVDPVITYSTYLGGFGSDSANAIAIDAAGNAYVAGETDAGDFPTTNPFQANLAGNKDVFVAKLSSSGTALLYSTYIGGSDYDIGKAIAVDASGNAYVTGVTRSADFPAANPLQANSKGYYDAFVTKLDPSGNALVYSTYLGGSEGDGGSGIAVDSSGSVYLTGEADSSNFPVGNSFQANYGGGEADVFVTKLNPSGNALIYSTYLGGSNRDFGSAIALDSSGNAYVTGFTDSGNFPTQDPFQAHAGGGGSDAFVAKLNPSGNALMYSTYLGGNNAGWGTGISVDSSGSAYVTGLTRSTNFPTVNPVQAQYGGGEEDAFVTKLNPSGNGLEYSTYLGGSGHELGSGIAVDSSGNACVTGETDSENFPTWDPVQTGKRGRWGDAFVTKLRPSGSAILYSTYLGGGVQNRGNGIAVDSSGNVYVTGATDSTDFPTVSPFQANSGLAGDSFVARIGDLRSALELTLLEGGASSRSTAGIGSSTQAGYAAATVTTGSSPYGVAVFSFRQNDVVVSEAAVPAAPPTTSARIFVDYRSGVAAMPGRSDAGSVDINTGLAVVNTGTARANMTYTLRNRTGLTVATGHGRLDGGAHFAKFVNQIKDVAPDFEIPNDFPTTTQFGSLDVAGDQPLSLVALRLTMNQRNEALLTSTPMADLTGPLGSMPLYFPQFVDGGGYLTTLILLNTSSGPETGKLRLLSNGGSPLVVNQIGGTRDSVFSYSIHPAGVFVFETDGSPADANAGSVQVIPEGNSSSPVGAGVFSFLQGGVRVTESGVPSASPTTHARIYIDQSGSHGTGLAIANPAASGISVVLKAFRTDGSTPAGTDAGVDLPGNGHTARFVSQLVSGLSADFTGVLDISSLSPFVALTLRSLTNSRDNFLLTTFPIADATRPAPAPIFFPQIADGGGYTTEFIFLGPGGASSMTLKLYGEDGTPLAVGK